MTTGGVKEQYESFPYPTRDPEDERHRLIQSPNCTLAAIDYMVFGGKRDWTEPFRVLVAGAGTGDAVIALAQAMTDAGVPGEVVYVDLSAASRRIAEERARIRGLANIVFKTGSLLDLSPSTDGRFDFVNCIGVLHHLEDPAAGLKALNRVLAPAGGMNLMVYATLGRAGVYPVQRMLRQIAPPHMPAEERISITRRLLAAMPQTSLLSRSPNIVDHRAAPGPEGDAGIYDLLLHSVDRSYLIGEFNELIEAEGLRISGFLPSCLYDPNFWCPDPAVREGLQGLDRIGRASFTENLLGFVKQHVVFAVRADNSTAPPDLAFDSVPIWTATPQGIPSQGAFEGTFSVQDIPMSLKFNEAEAGIFRLIDSRRTVAEIYAASGLREADFLPAIKKVCSDLHAIGLLVLRAGPS